MKQFSCRLPSRIAGRAEPNSMSAVPLDSISLATIRRSGWDQEEKGVLSEAGATMVEATLIIPLMLILVIVTFELLRVAYYSVSLQYVAERTIRQHSVTPFSAPNLQNAVINSSRNLLITVDPGDITLCKLPNATCNSIETTQPGDFVELRIRHDLPLIAALGNLVGLRSETYQMEAAVVGRNEP